MSRDCCQRLRGKYGGGGGAGRRSCYSCGELGHLATDCSQRVVGKYIAGGSGGRLRSCFVCGEPGHLAKDCHRRARPKNGAGGSGGGRCCFVCGEPGHLAMNCFQRVGGKYGAGGGGVRPFCTRREPEGLTRKCYRRVGGNSVDDGSSDPCISFSSNGDNEKGSSSNGYDEKGSSSNGYDEKGEGEEEKEEEKRVDGESLSNGNYRGGESCDNNGEMGNLAREPEGLTRECYQRVGGKYGGGGSSGPPIVIEISSSSSDEDEDEDEDDDDDDDEEEEKRVDGESLSNGNYRGGESLDTNGEMGNLSRKIGGGPIVIEISSSSSSEDEDEDEDGDEDEEEEEWVVGKKSTGSLDVKVRVKEEKRREEEEDDEDCVILDFDPFQPPTIDFMNKVSLSGHHLSVFPDEDISVISERGQVACRDYPHSRHDCAKYPFSKTAHESCCPQCYCYLCDVVAPCEFWEGNSGHCHASDYDKKWIVRRVIRRIALGGKVDSDLGESSGNSWTF